MLQANHAGESAGIVPEVDSARSIGRRSHSRGPLTDDEAARLLPGLSASGADLDHLMAQLGLEFA
jgi:hypothetical protein